MGRALLHTNTCAWCAEGHGKSGRAVVIRYGAPHAEHQAVRLDRSGAASVFSTASRSAAGDGPTRSADA